jgi:spermidine synthase
MSDARKPIFEILDWVDTPLGPLGLRRRELLGRPGTVVTEVSLDHELLMSSLNTAGEVALAERALAVHPGEGLDVLVGGLGLGYTAHAALSVDRVARVEVVEALGEVIGWLRGGLLPLSEALLADPRLVLTQGDVYARLLGPAERTHDLLLIDVDHSPTEPLGPGSAPFYTPAGLAQVKGHLRPGGVLAVWSALDDAAFSAALERSFSRAEVQRVRYTNELVDDGQETEDVLFLAWDPA